MAHINERLIKETTMHWIRSFIIEHDICPFAKHVVTAKTLSLQVIGSLDPKAPLRAFISAISRLDKDPDIDTSLLIYPDQLPDFFDYLGFVAMAEAWLEDSNYVGVYQLATFHPDYRFAGVDSDDLSNYTNRSPYPMLHLLRESSLDKAIAFYGDTSEIPGKNIKKMHRLGISNIKGK